MRSPARSSSEATPLARRFIWLAILLMCGLQAAWVFGHGLVGKSFGWDWDPGQHAVWGWFVWSDLVSGNWLSFLYDTYRQVYWPPLHSWGLAVAMLALGPSFFTVGLVSYLAYLVAGVELSILARRAEPRHGETAALVAAGLWLTAGSLLNRYATQAFTEMPAIAITGGALLLLSRAERLGTRAAWMWAGAGAMATYLTKTDYGIILMLGTAVGILLDRPAGHRRDALRRLLPWAVTITVLAALWFAYPAKIPATIAALVNRQQGPVALSLAGVSYHFASLVTWTDGLLLFGISLLALGATVLRPGSSLLRVLTAYVLVAFVLHTLSQTKDVKHIVKVVPWLFVLIGVQAARLRVAIATSSRRQLLGWVLGLVLAAAGVGRVIDFTEKVRRPGPNSADALVEALAARITAGPSHVVIGTFTAVSPHFVNWTVLGNNPRARVVPDPMTKTGFTREAFQQKLAALRRRAPILGWLEPGAEGPTYRIAYLLPKRGKDSTDAPQIIERLFRFDPDRVLLLTVAPGSQWDTENNRQFNHQGAAFLPHLRARPDLELTAELSFPEGVRLFVFDRRRQAVGASHGTI